MAGDLKQAAFSIFEKMKPGQILVIKEFAKSDPEKFIDYAKEWIATHTWEWEFNKNFEKLKRLQPIIK